VLAIYRP